MLAQATTIGLLVLFTAMLPGPDFVIVTHNTLMHSRRAGLLTALGIGSAIIIHISYCILGLALIIAQSALAFTIIKVAGAAYLIYLGLVTLNKPIDHKNEEYRDKQEALEHASILNLSQSISMKHAFLSGFLCNLFNPKATIFFLALFTLVIKPETPLHIELIYAIEIFAITWLWFSVLVLINSHPRCTRAFKRIETIMPKILGTCLIGFGILLLLSKHH